MITRILDGYVEAYAPLVDKYYAQCIRFANRMLGNREEAEEAVQDTFVRAYRSLDRYDHRGHFRAWLFSILVNRCRTRAAKVSRHQQLFVSSSDMLELCHPASLPDDPLQKRDLQIALLKLKPEYREVFLLKYVEELSYAEIEQITGDGVSALKMRVKRARDQLKQILLGA